MVREWKLLALCVLVSCSNSQTGLRWVVPEDFNGCVSASFNVSGAPPLPLEDGWYLLTVTDGRVMETSTEPRWGEGLRSEFWVQAGAERRRIEPSCHGGTFTNVDQNTVRKSYCFGKVSENECLKAKGALPK
jgi:hypothetical protein